MFYIGCIKSIETATDAKSLVQELELKNINVLNPVDLRCVYMYVYSMLPSKV